MVLTLAAGSLIFAHAADGGEISADVSPDGQALRHRGGYSLEERVKTLSQGLDLNAAQESALRKLLEGQREQVRKVWGEVSVHPAYRVRATQAIIDKTADQIRALLNEEQRKKYILPKQLPEAATGSAKRSVEAWMDAAKPK